ncbi:MAG: LysM peptidoglycan-binding domain-containing protein [Planctomycetota bacterium]
MARETKVGLIVGLGVILFVSVFVSDYLSVPEAADAMGDVSTSNYVDNTTNQPEFILTRDEETERAMPITTPRDLAAVSLQEIEQREGPPQLTEPEAVATPPFREAPALTGGVDDSTPIARNPVDADAGPVGFMPINDTHLALSNQLAPERDGPGTDTLADLAHVNIPDEQLIAARPTSIQHIVAEGETLTEISRKHYDGDGNLWRSIRDANPGKVGPNGEIVQGIALTIPKRSAEAAGPAAELVELVAGAGDRPQRQRVRMIVVQEGETLSELAADHLGSASKWQMIMDVNTDVLEKPEHLRAGMELRIPAPRVVEVIEEANEALTRASVSEVEDAIERIETNTYTVKEGDSLYRIAQELLGSGERYDEIYEANKDKLRSANDIQVGMTLRLPNR